MKGSGKVCLRMKMIIFLASIILAFTGTMMGDSSGQTTSEDDTSVDTNYPPGEIEWKIDLSVGSSGYIGMPCFLDLEGDGFIETLVIGTAYDPDDWSETTELQCLDHLGNVKWSHKMKNERFSSSVSPIVCDMDNDGELDILIFGTKGDWNDQRSFVKCLDISANLKWEVNISSEWINGMPVVANLDQRPGLEVIVITWDEIICIDQEGAEIWSVSSRELYFYQSPTIADIYNNGQMHVIIPTWNALICLDGDPSDGVDEGVAGIEPFDDSRGDPDVLWFKRWEEDYWKRENLDHVSVADLRGDGRLELIASGDQGQTICLNSDGMVVWESDIKGMTGSPTIGDVNGDGALEVLGMVNPYEWEWIDREDNGDEPVKPDPYDWRYRLVCINGENGSELWEYPTDWGGRTIILGDTDGDADLEVFFSSENNILAVDCDEDGNGEIDEEEVLWKFSSNAISGWSSTFLLGDVDHDGQLELVTTAGELIYCLSVGGKCPMGTIEWGKPFFDLQNSNRYESGLRSGVRIFPEDSKDGEKRTMVRYGEIGEVVSFDMKVQNTGSYDAYYGPSPGVDFRETFVLDSASLPPGWWATFNKYEVRLGPEETTSVRMDVKIPQGSMLDTSANIRVIVSSRLDPSVNDTQETVTIIKGLYNIELTCSDPIRGDSVPTDDLPIKPGDIALFRVTVTNLGEAEDTVLFMIEEKEGISVKAVLPTPNGHYSLNLGGGESRDFLIFAETSNDIPSGPMDFNLTGYSLGNANISDVLTLTVLVNSVPRGVHLSCSEPFRMIKPSGSVHFRITATNTLNRPAQVELNLTWNPLIFSCNINTTFLAIEPGSTAGINLTITAPDDVLADILCVVTLRSSDIIDPRNYDVIKLYSVVEHVYDIDFDVNDGPEAVDPGYTAVFPLSVRNLGNGFDHYRIDIRNLSGGFGLSFSEPLETLHPETRDRQNLFLNITTPDRTAAGLYIINITCISEGGKEIVDRLQLLVREVIGIRLTVEPVESFLSPGSKSDLEIAAINLGNSLRKFDLSILNKKGLEIEHPESIILGPYGAWTGKMEIKAPIDIELGLRSIYLAALTETSDGPYGNDTVFNITVTGTDLAWEEGSLGFKRSSTDNMISLKGTVLNLGNKPARNVLITIYEKGSADLIGEVFVDVIYWKSEISVHWLGGGDVIEIVAVIDPHDAVPEINERNNEDTLVIRGSKGEMGRSGHLLVIYFILGILSLLLLSISAAVIVRRRSEL
ncbi:MAG: hypothetical protein ACMUFK_02790 [Thermoplasmatota archaeon]